MLKLNKLGKGGKIALVAIVVIILALVYMWWSNKDSQPAEGVTIVTPMPQSGYSIEDVNNGIPVGMPDSLETTATPLQTDIPTLEPIDVISTTTAAAKKADVEEFDTFASNEWRGSIL
jgi:hypothetical protein